MNDSARKPVDDAKCRRCDDGGLLPRATTWDTCTCPAGAIVLEQRERRRA